MARAVAGGGEKGIERHIKRNKKMLIRDRIKLLLDKDSENLELSPLAGLGEQLLGFKKHKVYLFICLRYYMFAKLLSSVVTII